MGLPSDSLNLCWTLDWNKRAGEIWVTENLKWDCLEKLEREQFGIFFHAECKILLINFKKKICYILYFRRARFQSNGKTHTCKWILSQFKGRYENHYPLIALNVYSNFIQELVMKHKYTQYHSHHCEFGFLVDMNALKTKASRNLDI